MRTHTVPPPVTAVAELPGQSDRQHGSRTPALFGGATVYRPEPSLLGRGTSIWGGAEDTEVGGAESSVILLVGSTQLPRCQPRHLKS